jgi:crossover junction endodeoxyribonuclease RuvC
MVRMHGSSSYRLLGIDPGLNITGYAVMEFASREPAIIEAGTIRPDATKPMPGRIEQIYRELGGIIREFAPAAAAVEKLYAHYKHPRTSIIMAHARGAVLLACEHAGIAVHDLAATEIKRSLTGNGHASKQQVQRAIQAVCRLDALPEPPDVADAIAIALCAGRHLGT